MILFFSGTGNGKYIANRIAAVTSDEVVSINDKMKNKDTQEIEVNGKLVFVLPTYAWRIPRVVREWILSTAFKGVENVWFVMSCGGEIGNAAKYNKELCEQKNFVYKGTAQIVMPDNYILMFKLPEEKKLQEIVEKANPIIADIAKQIVDNKEFAKPRNNLYDRFMSGPVNSMFYSMYVKADKFKVSDKCIGCGKCAKMCPLNNICMQDGKPTWGKDCTQCMACISYCPVEAIDYGKKTVGKRRYRME